MDLDEYLRAKGAVGLYMKPYTTFKRDAIAPLVYGAIIDSLKDE